MPIEADWLQPLPLMMDGALFPTRFPTNMQAADLALPDPAIAQYLSLNEAHPQQVQAAHQSFVAAGAVLHRTNTAWANRIMLAHYQLVERVEALNASAIAHVRNGIRSNQIGLDDISPTNGQDSAQHSKPPTQCMVAGVLSQLPACFKQVNIAAKQQAYGEQAVILADGGVDCLMLEGCDDLAETIWLITFLKKLSDAPLLCMVQPRQAEAETIILENWHTAHLQRHQDALARMVDAGVDAIGITASLEWPHLLACCETFLKHEQPVAVAGSINQNNQDSHLFINQMSTLARMGVHILGGSQGTSPADIQALKQALKQAANK